MGAKRFCEKLVYLDGAAISFQGREYLDAVYGSTRNLALRCSRQVEKTTFLVNTIMYNAACFPGIKILFCCPRDEQVGVFSKSRLAPVIIQSPVLRRILFGRGSRRDVKNILFSNGSELFLRACYRNADAARGLSVSLLAIDEFQDLARGCLPVLQETLSHAKCPRTILAGTPKVIDNHLETAFCESTANEWYVCCTACSYDCVMDEHVLGLTSLVCPKCQTNLLAASGRWVPRNPSSVWGDGFSINHLMAPWVTYDTILARQREYDLPKFRNECLGLSVSLGDHIITRAEIEACAQDEPMASSLNQVPPAARQKLIAGIDWGAGGSATTVIVIGYVTARKEFRLVKLQRLKGTEDPEHVLDDLARICKTFHVRNIAADGGGPGAICNRLLLGRVPQVDGFYSIFYSASDSPPRPDGALWRWTVDRSSTIAVLFSRIKKKLLLFPRIEDSRPFFPDFTGIYAEYDDYDRTYRYCHVDGQPDDALHAVNYAQLLALHYLNAR